jgi:hypothetical protein
MPPPKLKKVFSSLLIFEASVIFLPVFLTDYADFRLFFVIEVPSVMLLPVFLTDGSGIPADLICQE